MKKTSTDVHRKQKAGRKRPKKLPRRPPHSTIVYHLITMKDPLPVPDQLEKQLAKCKSIRDADTYHKSREKTPQVNSKIWLVLFILCVCAVDCVVGIGCCICCAYPLPLFILERCKILYVYYLYVFSPCLLWCNHLFIYDTHNII